MTDSKIKIGKLAPALTLESDNGEKIKLSDYRGESNVVLYFYPKDNTPGCTKEAQAFQKSLAKFTRQNTVILGISPDSVESHVKFRDKFNLKFPLLADVGAKVASKYGVWVEKNMYGRKYMGVQRATFLIDQDGKVAQIWPKVKVAGHEDEVLEAVKALNA